MQLTADFDNLTLRLAFPDAEGARALLEGARAQGAFLLHLPQEPRAFYTYAVTVEAPGFAFAFEATAVQVLPPQAPGAACSATFQLEEWPKSKEMELTRKLSAGAGAAGAAAAGADQPAIFRIKGMNVAEKMRLAPMADRHERQVLLRDSSAQVLLALLNNPHLQNDDVLAIVKSTHASGGVLQRVAKDRRWAANPEVQAALVRNPKTPSPVAVQMVEVLRTGDLRDLAKSRHLRENVRKAALRVYLKRSGQG